MPQEQCCVHGAWLEPMCAHTCAPLLSVWVTAEQPPAIVSPFALSIASFTKQNDLWFVIAEVAFE